MSPQQSKQAVIPDGDVEMLSDPQVGQPYSSTQNAVNGVKAVVIVLRGEPGEVTDALRQGIRKIFAQFASRRIAHGLENICAFEQDVHLCATGKAARQEHIMSYVLIYTTKASAINAQHVMRAELEGHLRPFMKSVPVARTLKLTGKAITLCSDASALEMDVIRNPHKPPEIQSLAADISVPIARVTIEQRKRRMSEQQIAAIPRRKARGPEVRSIAPTSERHPVKRAADPADVLISELLAEPNEGAYVARPGLCKADDW